LNRCQLTENREVRRRFKEARNDGWHVTRECFRPVLAEFFEHRTGLQIFEPIHPKFPQLIIRKAQEGSGWMPGSVHPRPNRGLPEREK
jgi:hypothetical protein